MNRADPNEIYALLEQQYIPYRKIEHPAAASMEDLQGAEAQLGAVFCKNLFLCNRQKTVFYLLLIREDKRFRTATVSKLIGSSRLSFASHEDMESLLHTAPGSASILGLLFDTEHRVQLVMDRDVYDAEYFCCHPCDNHGSLKIKTSDLLTKFLPHVGHEPIVVDLPRE